MNSIDELITELESSLDRLNLNPEVMYIDDHYLILMDVLDSSTIMAKTILNNLCVPSYLFKSFIKYSGINKLELHIPVTEQDKELELLSRVVIIVKNTVTKRKELSEDQWMIRREVSTGAIPYILDRDGLPRIFTKSEAMEFLKNAKYRHSLELIPSLSLVNTKDVIEFDQYCINQRTAVVQEDKSKAVDILTGELFNVPELLLREKYRIKSIHPINRK